MIKKIAFLIYFIITVVLMSATVIEKFEGTEYIQESIYSAWWFYLLWAIMGTAALKHILDNKLHKDLPIFMLHLSFITILLGAITTATTAQRGTIYLEINQNINSFVDDNNHKVDLPFNIRLHDFEIEYYSGTRAAANYISYITFEGANQQEAVVSMNKIAKYEGYRFYQSGYDNKGTILSVNRDIYGIPITYGGYFLLAISLLAMLLSPKGAFRRSLRSPLFRGRAMTILLFLLSTGSVSASTHQNPQSLSTSQIESLDRIQVVYNNRVMPLTTLAHDFTLKLVGDTKYKKEYSSEQFFWGWLLFPSDWEEERIFEVPLSKKQEFLQLNPISRYKDFFTEKGIYKLDHYIRNTEPKSEQALYKDLQKLNEQIQLVAMLRSGAMLKIFPHKDSTGLISWYSPIDELPSDMESGQALFIQNSLRMLLSTYKAGNDREFDLIVSKIVSYQNKYGGDSLIPTRKVKAEQWYYSLSVTRILYRFNFLLGILALIALIVTSKQTRFEKIIVRMLKCSMIHAVILLAIYIGLKWYITGRMPLVNGYDTMVFLGWCIASITLFVSRNSPFFTAMGTILVGFTMLVATLGGMNPQITPLIPVLNSPFLTTHVCFIMLSYTLFAFTFVNGIIALTAGQNNHDLMQRTTLYSRIFLMLGISFLAVGIFIGAIWANVSWGRYWAWDPKEVWALITMMIYTIPLHNRSLPIFNKPKMFHIYLIIAFSSVLMTYFGVNYILGGMHSYA